MSIQTRFGHKKILRQKETMDYQLIFIKPDCAFKTDLEPFIFQRYAICTLLRICHIYCAHHVSCKLSNRNFGTNLAWEAEEGISIFLFYCAALLPSALKISTSSTSVKHESKRLRSASWTEKKSSVPEGSKWKLIEKNTTNMAYTTFAWLYYEFDKMNTLTGSWF